MAIFLQVNNLDKVFQNLNKFEENIKLGIALEINASALNIQSNAKKMAPVNFGTLRNSIYLKEEDFVQGKLNYSVGSNVSYAPYIEFGTGGKVSIPSNYQSFASQFKGGKKGAFKDFILALMLWVKRKGIVGTYSVKTQRRTGSKSLQASQEKSAAYAIALSILKKGLRPQPFLIPAFEQEKPKLTAKIKQIIQNAKS